MATGGEPASAGNVKAFYEMLKNGGVSEGFIKDLKALRKAMGLGDTLGVLPIENMQLKVSDEVSGLSAADGYAISPKGVYDFMNELLNRQKSGARIISYYSNDDPAFIVDASGTSLSKSNNTVKVNTSGAYIVTACALCSSVHESTAVSASLIINDNSVPLAYTSYETKALSNSSKHDKSATGSAVIFLNKGDVISAPKAYGDDRYLVSITEQ